MNEPTGLHQVREAARALGARLRAARELRQLAEAEVRYRQDEGLAEKIRAFQDAARRYQEAQAAGSLTAEVIGRVREAQTAAQTHPSAQDFAAAQEAVRALLQGINESISSDLGLDFAQVARPPGRGC